MASKNPHKEIVHATKEGRLYIKNSDFFNQEKVIEIIRKLEDSSIRREIDTCKKAV